MNRGFRRWFSGTVRSATVTGALCLLLGTARAAWEIPLAIEAHGATTGRRHVSSGIPLLPGQAGDLADLRLATKDDDGRLVALPAQFRELARWWRADNSLRWVLADFIVELGDGPRPALFLTNAKLPMPGPARPVRVEVSDGLVAIDTGAARFTVNRQRFNGWQSVTVGDRELLAADDDSGLVLEDVFGEPHFGSEATRSVEVIEAGPLRVRLRARGVHRARQERGYGRGLYQYDVFMDFFSDSPAVLVDAVIANNFAESIGSPAFADASLWLRLKGPATGCSLAGHRGALHDGAPAAGESVCLYQDSNGADTWNRCQGYNTERRDYWRFPEGQTASFRGYKVWRRAGNEAHETASGDQATGAAHLRTAEGGVVMHMRNFWQQFPKGVEAFGDGRLRVALFPREYKVPHFLEDATGKGHEIVFYFHGPDNVPNPADIARAWEQRVMARPASLEHLAACGALADTGPFTPPTRGLDARPNNRTEAYGSRMLTADGLYGNAYGWQIFGERWRSCGGHSSRGARQPMNEDNYLYRWLMTGERGWWLNGDARSRHFRDVRAYRIEDVDPFDYRDWDHFRARNRSEDYTRRAQPNDEEAQKYAQGRYARSTFWLPNPAHQTLDLPYDRFLLTGDQRAGENLRVIAAHGGYFSAYRGPAVHRDHGWSWRALFRYWELTGDQDAERLLHAAIANYLKMAEGDFPLPASGERVNWWFTFVFARAAAMTALHTRRPDALTVCRRLAERIVAEREKRPDGYGRRAFAEFFGALYHLTGDESYRKEGLGDGDDDDLLDVAGRMFMPACGHWLLHATPRPL